MLTIVLSILHWCNPDNTGLRISAFLFNGLLMFVIALSTFVECFGALSRFDTNVGVMLWMFIVFLGIFEFIPTVFMVINYIVYNKWKKERQNNQ
jgi:hypothetical protein